MYADRATAYAEKVVAGEIPACTFHRQACKRHLADLKRDDIDWRPKAVNHACGFIEQLPHVKGRWASRRETLKLEDWQVFIVASIFGWYRDDLRRFTEAYVEVPRKNGKSTLAAGILLYCFCEFLDMGREVFSLATTEAQAHEVFRPMRQMVQRTPELRKHYDITVAAKSLYIMSDGSRAEPLIGKPGDGASPSAFCCDEMHEHHTSDAWDTMKTGQGARGGDPDSSEPLGLAITTAGDNLGGPCYEMRGDIIRILEGQVEDDQRFGIIFGIDDDDEWDTLESAEKANPNFGVSISPRFIEGQMAQARRSASKQNAFVTKHLNRWVGAKVSWMNMLAWQRQRADLNEQDFAGHRAWLGVDLASKKDVAAVVALVEDTPGKFATFGRYFAPEECDNDKYQEFATSGELTLTPGSATDYAFIEEAIKEWCAHFDVQHCGFDPWQAQYLAQRLHTCGVPVIEFPHQVRTFSDPMKEIEAMVLDRKLRHDDAMLTWMVGNVVVKADAKENIYPTKSRPHDERCKIDGLVALIMATGLMLREKNEGTLAEWLDDGVMRI